MDKDETSSKKSSLFHRGKSARKRVDTEIEKQKAARSQDSQPYRFFCPVGETRQFIIVDEEPDFFMYEHSMKNPRTGKWGFHVPCIKEAANCPVCESAGESYYAMFLTIVDLTPFTTSRGTEVEFSRKLLMVKPNQQKKFIRRFEKDGSLRGALFETTRDKQMESAIGGDIEFIEFVDEDELVTYERSWKDQQGKRQVEKCHEPFVYEELFEEPTEASLRALVGGEPTPGSRAQVEETLDEDDGDEWEEEDEKEPSFDPDEEESDEEKPDEEEEPDEEPEPAPRARRRRPGR